MPEGYGGGGSSSLREPEVYQARKLRRTMRLPEVMLWQQLRAGRIGVKVRRQHPIGPYLVDFFIRDLALVIEVDGEAHNRGSRPERDQAREDYLIQQGYRLLRVPATEVLNDVAFAVAGIAAQLRSPLHRPSDGPPPRSGEEP